MTNRRLLLPLIFAFGASAQRIQNIDSFFMAGPTFTGTHVIGGTGVTLYGRMGFSDTTGFGYQIMRKSALSLWIEVPMCFLFQLHETASVNSAFSPSSILITPGVRLMVPVHSRVSLFGVAGAGYGGFSYPTLTSDNPPFLTTNNVYHGVIDAGGGVDVRLNRRFSLRVDVRDYITGRNLNGVAGRNHVLPALGVAVHF